MEQGVRTGKSWERENHNKNIVYEKNLFSIKEKRKEGGRKEEKEGKEERKWA